MNQLHPKTVWLFFWKNVFIGLVLFIVVVFYAISLIGIAISEGNFSGVIFLWLIPIFIIYLLFCYVIARLAYRNWKYELSEKAVKLEKGIIMKKYVSIPYNRIQNVDIYRTLLARILGLSELHIQTAGYSGGSSSGLLRRSAGSTEGNIPGIDPHLAEQIREELVKRAETVSRQGL